MMQLDKMSFLREHFRLQDPQLLQSLSQSFEIRELDKKEILHQIGLPHPSIDFLVEGLFRGFFLDRAGKEITDCFVFRPGTPIVSCLELGEPSFISTEAMEPSTILSIPLEQVNELMPYPEILGLYIRFLRESLLRHWENKIMLAQYTAKDRYTWFLEKYPGVIDRVNHRYVASFLGITPVTLARIRRAGKDAKLETMNSNAIKKASEEGTLL